MEETSPPGRQGKKADSSRAAGKASRPPRKGSGKRRSRRRLSAEAITEAAMRVADADGIDAVSIRRVAAELGARPMSLYGHISSKDELLSSMADKATKEVLVQQPLPEDWREAIAAIARRLHATFIAHPWLVLLFTRHASFGPNATKLAKQSARAVASLSLPSADVWVLQGTVNDFVLGHSLRAVSAPTSDALADAISDSDVVEFPELATLQDTLRTRFSTDSFELGLQSVLDGVEQRFLGSKRKGR